MLRNPVIAMDETFQEIFPSLLEIAKAKLYKVHVFECAYNHIIVHHIIAFNWFITNLFVVLHADKIWRNIKNVVIM